MQTSPRLLLLWLSLVLSSAPARAQVIISEFMADNKHTLADEDGEFSDWIELYNPTDDVVTRVLEAVRVP